MTRTCGVRVIVARRSGVRGCASGSASAAAWISASVMASARVQSCFVFVMVPPSLKGFGQPRRNDTNGIASHGINNTQKASFHHPKRHEALFALVLAFVWPIEPEGVVEHVTRGLERNAMLRVVRDGLGVVPLESAIVHKYTA